MKVLVDTSVWSLALRRRAPAHAAVDELRALVAAGRAAMCGVIRQEILSGIRETSTFDRLREQLRAFTDEAITVEDYERAAAFYNACRAKGVQGSNTDFLLCAVCANHRLPIFTTDADFPRYAKLLPIELHSPA